MIGDDDVFADALSVPAAKRTEFLTVACQGDLAQFARVEALLRGHNRAQEILNAPRIMRDAGPCPRRGRVI